MERAAVGIYIAWGQQRETGCFDAGEKSDSRNAFLLTLPLLITLNAKNIIKREREGYTSAQHRGQTMQF